MAINIHPYKNRKYTVVPYDPKWVGLFEAEKSKLRKIFGDNVRIEHMGSTAVSGLSGKPCIDVLVLVKDLEIVKLHSDAMQEEGYDDAGDYVMENSHLFRRMNDNTQLANIHFFPHDHPHVKEILDLRNYLRSHPDIVDEYSKLKNTLYIKYPSDYASYRKHKDKYLAKLLRTATLSHP